MRTLTIPAAIGILLFCGLSASEISASPVYWVTDADGAWVEASNWSSDPDRPKHDDDVIIDVGGETARTIDASNFYEISILSLLCEENLVIQSANTYGTSFRVGAGGGVINGQLDMSNCKLNLLDGGIFHAYGATTLTNGSINAHEGGQVYLPNLTSWTLPSSGTNTIRASGVDGTTASLVDLPALESFIGAASSKLYCYATDGGRLSMPAVTQMTGYRLTIEATGESSSVDLSAVSEGMYHTYVLAKDGGTVDLQSMTTCLTYCADIKASGAGSSIDLSSLSNFCCYKDTCSTGLTVTDGGRIILSDALTELDGVCLRIGQGELATNYFTSIRGANITVTEGATACFDALTELDDCDVYAQGGTVMFPSLTTITDLGVYGLRAWGDSSIVDLSSVTTISGGGSIVANDGGRLDLSSLESMSGGKYWIDAYGEGCVVDLSALTSFSDTTSTFRMVSGGQIILPESPAEWTNVNVDVVIGPGGLLECEGLQKITKGEVSVSLGTLSLPALSYVKDCSFIASSGAQLTVPALTAICLTDEDSCHTFKATGCDDLGTPSLLDLSSVAQIDGDDWQLDVYATDGATVDLSSLSSVQAGLVALVAEDEGSVLDVSGLTTLSGGNETYASSLQALDDGEIVVSPLLQQLNNVSITVSGGGILDTDGFLAFDDVCVEAKEDSNVTFTNLSYVKDLWLYATMGGSISFPNAKALYFRDDDSTDWTAIHDGHLDLSSVASIHGYNWELDIATYINSSVDCSSLKTIYGDGWEVDISMLNSGDALVDFSSLISADDGRLNLEIHGDGCIVDFSSLMVAGGDSTIRASWEVTSEALLLINQTETTTVHDMDISIYSDGMLSGHTLQLDSSATLSSDTCIDANLYNVAGIIAPATDSGESAALEVSGDFIQESNGTLELDITSLLDFDELIVKGDAWLDGTLTLNFSDSFSILSDQSYPIISIEGQRFGTFDQLAEGSVVWTSSLGEPLYITYCDGSSGTSVALTTVVAEPSTLVSMGIAMMVLAGFARRRRNRNGSSEI